VLDRLRFNWPFKLLSLAIAMALWAFVVGQEKAEITVKMPVEVTGLPANMVLGNKVVNELEVRLYGPQNLVRQVAAKPMVKQLVLGDLAVGEHSFPMLAEDLDLPPSVSVVRISPDRLQVVLAKRFTREAAVRPVIKGNPPRGFEVAEVTFKPAAIKVSGLKRELTDLDWVWTVPLDVSQIKKTTTVKAALRQPAGRTIRLEPPAVEAVINIRPRPGQPPEPDREAGKQKGAEDGAAK
jgi:YbbR domain-containing protein